MGPAPEAMLARKAAQIAEKKEKEAEASSTVATHRDTRPPQLAAASRLIQSLWWEYHLRHIDRMEMLAPTDRAFDRARSQALRDINDGVEALLRGIHEIYGQAPPPSEELRRSGRKAGLGQR